MDEEQGFGYFLEAGAASESEEEVQIIGLDEPEPEE